MPPENENAEATAEFSPEQVADAPVADEVTEVDAPSSEQDDAAASEVVADPVQSRLDELGLNADRVMQLQSAVGRVGGLQSEVDKGSKRVEELLTRMDNRDQLLVALAQGISTSDVLDEQSKTSVASLIDTFQSQSDRAAMMDELRSEMQTAQQPPLPPEWQQAQQRIVSYAQSQNVDPTTIPAEIWQKGSQSENPFEAVDIARDWVDDQDGRNGRLARRKAAAGANPPAAAVPAKSKDPLTIIREWGDDPNSHSLEEAKQAMLDTGYIRR